MLKIDLITVGKLKEDYLRRACEEYAKRLGSYCKLQIFELPEYKVPQNPSDAHIANCIQQEDVYKRQSLRLHQSYDRADPFRPVCC